MIKLFELSRKSWQQCSLLQLISYAWSWLSNITPDTLIITSNIQGFMHSCYDVIDWLSPNSRGWGSLQACPMGGQTNNCCAIPIVFHTNDKKCNLVQVQVGWLQCASCLGCLWQYKKCLKGPSHSHLPHGVPCSVVCLMTSFVIDCVSSALKDLLWILLSSFDRSTTKV